MRKIFLPISLAAALTVSACSTNYGVYSKTDPKNDEFGYLSTYIALLVSCWSVPWTMMIMAAAAVAAVTRPI